MYQNRSTDLYSNTLINLVEKGKVKGDKKVHFDFIKLINQ